MDTFDQIIGAVTGGHVTAGLIILGTVVLLYCLDLYFWARKYARIPGYRGGGKGTPKTAGGISVVVILSNDFHYLENTLPKIMAQEYDDHELVVVDVASSPEFCDELAALRERYPNLATARLDPDHRFRISDKMIFNVGIKTARHDNIILTTPDAYPTSPGWLGSMSKGFAHGDVVLGYCGLQVKKGLANRLMRCGRLMLSVRYLSSAISGRPYRGILQNMGFTKGIYMDSRGFNHLNMTVGEDDLYVQKIATRENTGVVVDRQATVRQTVYGGAGGWWQYRRSAGTSQRHYPGWARRAANTELWVRFLLMAAIAATGIFMPLYTFLGTLGLWLARSFVVRHQTARISRRLGEYGLNWTMMIYDIAEPFILLALSLSRRVRKPKEAWK